MTLTHLSLCKTKPGHRKDAVPIPYTNDQRARVYRLHQESPRHNTHDWPHGRRQRYASEQLPPSDEEMRDAYRFKYGA